MSEDLDIIREEIYKRKRDNPDLSFLEIIAEIIEDGGLSFTAIGDDIKKDKTLFNAIRDEALESGIMIEGLKTKSVDINTILEG